MNKSNTGVENMVTQEIANFQKRDQRFIVRTNSKARSIALISGNWLPYMASLATSLKYVLRGE